MKALFIKTFKFLNILVALALVFAIISYSLPFDTFSYLSVFGLITPLVILGNLLFLLFWLFLRDKFVFVSLILLLVSLVVFENAYKFGPGEEDVVGSTDFSIMSFNVRFLNKYRQIPKAGIDSAIIGFIRKQSPDILCLQESHYTMKSSRSLDKIYPYKIIDFEYGVHQKHAINAVYSKFPILNHEAILFPNSKNATLWADLLIGRDTVRLYNFHLQSFNVIPDVDKLTNKRSYRLLVRVTKGLKKQEQQVEALRTHMSTTKGPILLAGDLNNTQFSKVYRYLRCDFQDSFLTSGAGLGGTYPLFGIPLRIDHIFADSCFKITSHTNFDVKLSDHYPIMATMRLHSKE